MLTLLRRGGHHLLRHLNPYRALTTTSTRNQLPIAFPNMSPRVIVYSSQNYVQQYIAPIIEKAFPGSTYVEVPDQTSWGSRFSIALPRHNARKPLQSWPRVTTLWCCL